MSWLFAPVRLRSMSAFTLIELLVVVLILAVLIAVAAPSFLGQTTKAQDSAAKQYLTVAYKNAKAYATDGNGAESHVQGNFDGFDKAELEAMEPTLVGHDAVSEGGPVTCPDSAAPGNGGAGEKNHIYIAQASGDNLTICNDPDDRVWVLKVLDGELQPLELYLCDESGNCVLAEGAADEPVVPQNTALPQISGTAAVGATLTTTDGTWTNSPTSFSYQWQRCDVAETSCSDVGTNSNSYTAVVEDQDSVIRVVVTASNDDGPSLAATSDPTAVVQAGTGSYADVIEADGPTSYWRFGESSTAAGLADEKSKNPGTYTGSPTLGVQGAISNDSDTAMTVATSGQGASVPDSSDFDIDAVGGFTFEAWVKTPATIGGYATIARNSGTNCSSGGAPGWLFSTNSSGTRLFFQTGNGLSPQGAFTSTIGLTANAWNHVAFTYSGTTVTIYINGTAAGSGGAGGYVDATAPLTFGYASACLNPATGWSFDEIAVYSGKVLSSGQIQNHYASSSVGPPVNTAAPVLSGNAYVSSTLTTSNGAWSGTQPVTYSYQWQRSLDGTNWSNISGSTSIGYTVAAGDDGYRLRAQVKAANSVGQAYAYSAATAPVTAAPSYTFASNPSFEQNDNNGLDSIFTGWTKSGNGYSAACTASCYEAKFNPQSGSWFVYLRQHNSYPAPTGAATLTSTTFTATGGDITFYARRTNYDGGTTDANSRFSVEVLDGAGNVLSTPHSGTPGSTWTQYIIDMKPADQGQSRKIRISGWSATQSIGVGTSFDNFQQAPAMGPATSALSNPDFESGDNTNNSLTAFTDWEWDQKGNFWVGTSSCGCGEVTYGPQSGSRFVYLDFPGGSGAVGASLTSRAFTVSFSAITFYARRTNYDNGTVDANSRMRVQVLDSNDNVLRTVFDQMPASSTAWTQYSISMASDSGQVRKIRIQGYSALQGYGIGASFDNFQMVP